jgi:Transglycosylase SLT domain
MARLLLAALIFCLSARIAIATPGRLMPVSPGEECRSAIAAAEKNHGVPPRLLAAIGRVESGRRDPITGSWGPWPWTINAEGQGSWFESKADAIRAVETLRARGVRSIDIGCMQVNLMHHPAAFANLDLAFQPSSNAEYAADFLVRLHDQTGDWTKATANYHSANSWEGDPYAAKVMSVWPEEQRLAGLNPPVMRASARAGMMTGVVSPFAARQPPRMLPLGGSRPSMVRSGMTIPGLPQADGLAAGTVPASIPSSGMTQIGMAPMGGLPRGIRSAGPGSEANAGARNVTSPGRGLDFYRAAPVGSVPFRQMSRGAFRLAG